ncbi:hypothetical protein SEUCBS140593_003621 [Sporothrix eucalyptigena]|uniref:Uncharacterized protein n=1 Tax=Sporothrix eucalyptigena TaxID=1812306 RepID=A0ABP0BGN0_9PEZI
MTTYLTPTAYLDRIGGGQTAAENEIWDTAHRLYVYLATGHGEDNLTRIQLFQRLVRLCYRHRSTLLDGFVALRNGEILEACTTCCHRENASPSTEFVRTIGHCCWYRPDAQALAFLQQLLTLCDSQYHELFNGSRNAKELIGIVIHVDDEDRKAF